MTDSENSKPKVYTEKELEKLSKELRVTTRRNGFKSLKNLGSDAMLHCELAKKNVEKQKAVNAFHSIIARSKQKD